MLHLMLERGEQIEAVLYCDMGDWEFPEMQEHIDLVQERTGLHIIHVYPPDLTHHAFFYEYENAYNKKGWGWPSPTRRWCTAYKRVALDKEAKRHTGVSCIGIAIDEIKRKKHPDKRYPLIEYGYTEEMCLQYCKKLGYTWGGLYGWRKRVSCWCCPLQSLDNLRGLRKNKPELWQKLIDMDSLTEGHPYQYKDVGVIALEARFSLEELREESNAQ